jgi:hypothetical protein
VLLSGFDDLMVYQCVHGSGLHLCRKERGSAQQNPEQVGEGLLVLGVEDTRDHSGIVGRHWHRD